MKCLEEPTVDAAMQFLLKADPKHVITHAANIEAGIKRFRNMTQAYQSPFREADFNLPGTLVQWVDEELPKTERAKCLVLLGESRLGKTAWARSLGRHMYFRGHFNIDKWDPEAKYIVFDDIPWAFIPQKKSLLTQMGECDITQKYRPVRTINVTMPAIVLANPGDGPDEFMYDPKGTAVHPLNDPYWNDNAVVYMLNGRSLAA